VFNNKKKNREMNFIDDEIVVGKVSVESKEKTETIYDSNQDVKKEQENDSVKSSIEVLSDIESGRINLGKKEREQEIKQDEKIFKTSINFDDEKDAFVRNNQDYIEEHIVDKEPLYTKEDIEEDVEEDINENTSNLSDIDIKDGKKDINEYFKKGTKRNKKLKKASEKRKKKSKKQLKMEQEFETIRDQKFYIFEKMKYRKIDNFIKYLDKHYKDIDQIAPKLLADEKFYEWISKRSGVFDESLEKFKKIKEKIEK